MKYFFLIFLSLSFMGCKTTADSNYELNRRSGLSISEDLRDKTYNVTENEGIKTVAIKTATTPEEAKPTLVAPKVEKIWLNGQQINEDTWLQGTWIYLQVEKAKWK